MTEGRTNSSAPSSKAASRPRFDYGSTPSTVKVAVAPKVKVTKAAAVPALALPTWAIWLGLAFLAVFARLYYTNFVGLTMKWTRDSGWSHGFAVPLLAGVLVYLQWDRIAGLPVRGSPVGVALAGYGVFAQVLFQVFGFSHMANLSMLIVLIGGVLAVLGWDYLKVLWLPVCYLGFMIPPPESLYVRLTGYLQIIATELGVALLPLLGVQARSHGVVIDVLTRHEGMQPLNVAEACSGIRSLLAFVALAVVLAYTTRRPVWQKITLAGCAIPVAILCNALRVALTGAARVYMGEQWAHGAAHEYLGFLMLVPAGIIQLGIGWILTRIFIEGHDHGASQASAPACTPVAQASAAPSATMAPLYRRPIFGMSMLVGIIACGTLSLVSAERMFDIVLTKPPAPLNKPLIDLPRFLPGYEAGPSDRFLPPEVAAVLGADDYLLRDFTNTADRSRGISLNINYYASGFASPHVPDVCWAGNGMQQVRAYDFVVRNVRHKDGTVNDVTMRMVCFAPHTSDEQIIEPIGESERFLNVAYVFQVNGAYVTTKEQVSKRFWDPRARYAYHTKIEITPRSMASRSAGGVLVCPPQQAEEISGDFLRASLAAIEECLPDQAALEGRTGPETTAGGGPASGPASSGDSLK